MNDKFSFRDGVLLLPAAVLACVPPDGAYFRVLLSLAAHTRPSDGGITVTAETVAAETGLPAATVENALSYWRQQNILKIGDTAAQTPAVQTAEPPSAAAQMVAEAQKQKQKPRPALPEYTQAELADILSASAELLPTLNSCAQIAGKTFSEHETAQLVALYDSYNMDSAYLMMLFAFCKSERHKTAVSYIVRTAMELYDEGVRTTGAFEQKINNEAKLRDASYEIRKMFGFGERELSKNERTFLETWLFQWSMPMGVIRAAYDITVNNTGKASMAYLNKILLTWNDNNIRTVEAAEAYAEAYRQKKNGADGGKAVSGGVPSFDLDEFLALAMQRSF